MRLIDLQPRWIERAGERVMFIFKCPHCPGSTTWLSCKRVAMKTSEQYDLIAAHCADLRDDGALHEVVSTKQDVAWTIIGDDFETMTVSPSIDASPSGDWHGFIRNGEIQ